MMSEFGIKLDEPTALYIDNKGAVDLANDYVSNAKTKHIKRRHLKVRELVEEMVVKATSISTEDNFADIFTKPLGRRAFEKHRRTVLNHE